MEGQLLLSINQAADRLSLSPWTLRLWVKSGKLRAVRLGSRVLIEPREIEQLLEAGRRAGAIRGTRVIETTMLAPQVETR